MRALAGQIGAEHVPFTTNDTAVWRRLMQRCDDLQLHAAFKSQVRDMAMVGKYELQCLFRHPQRADFFTFGFVLQAILRADYI